MNTSDSTLPPLCVDLDGTLLRSDMLLESTLLLLKNDPLAVVKIPFWLAKGKGYLKHKVASQIDINQLEFPYNEEVYEYVSSQKDKRKTVLVTGSSQLIADRVASDCALFDDVVGSTSEVNLTSNRKRGWLEDNFAENGFDYIGNDTDDLDVWPCARNALVVSTPNGIAKTSGLEFSKVFTTLKPSLKDYFSLLRVHQWSKNALVLLPFILDQRLGDTSALIAIVLAFFAMSLLASVTYIVNDMLDLQADRQNATKRKRALASGAVSLVTGFKVAALMLVVLALLMSLMPATFNLILLSYAVLTLLYSFSFKRFAILDVCIIAALHTIRVIAGGEAINAEWSFWLLAFSMFLFFSFALAKRVAELTNLKMKQKDRTIGRDYHVSDIPVLMAMGVGTGYLSVLVVALYINSEKVRLIYSMPVLLWLVCPILMYWIGRIWLKTARGVMHEDPIVFALRDRVSIYVIGFGVVVVVAAKLLLL